MNILFTGCEHYMHNNIIHLCKRPFKDAHDQTNSLIHISNRIVGYSDYVYHLGDYYLNNDPKTDDLTPMEITDCLHGNHIFLQGNHDDYNRNGLKTFNHEIILKIKKLFIQLIHDPKDANVNYPLVLHSHVHNEYKIRELKYRRKISLLYNVGVDVNNFQPVALHDIMNIYNHWLYIKKDYGKVKEFLKLHNKGTNVEKF